MLAVKLYKYIAVAWSLVKVTDYLSDDHVLLSRHMAMELEFRAECTRMQLGIFFIFGQDKLYRNLGTNVHT